MIMNRIMKENDDAVPIDGNEWMEIPENMTGFSHYEIN